MAIGITQRLRRRIYGRDALFPEKIAGAVGSAQWVLGNIVRAHHAMRLSIGILATFYPFILIAIGCGFGLSIPGSISEYYWYPSAMTDAPVRVFFTGGLYAIGAFLIGYRGYTRGEDRLYSLSGACALGVATIPMVQDGHGLVINNFHNPLYGHGFIHGLCAVGLFVFLAIAILMYSRITLTQFGNPKFERNLWRIYKGLALWMIFFPLGFALYIRGLLAPLLEKSPDDVLPWLIYLVEIFAIVPFGIFWLIKTAEISLSEFDKKVERGMVPTDPSGNQEFDQPVCAITKGGMS